MADNTHEDDKRITTPTEELLRSIQSEVKGSETAAGFIREEAPTNAGSTASTLVEMPAFRDDEEEEPEERTIEVAIPEEFLEQAEALRETMNILDPDHLSDTLRVPDVGERAAPEQAGGEQSKPGPSIGKTLDESTGDFDERADTSLTPESKQPTRITVPAEIIQQHKSTSSKTTKVVVPEQLLTADDSGVVNTLEDFQNYSHAKVDPKASSSRKENEGTAEPREPKTLGAQEAPEDRTVVVHRPIPAPEVAAKSIEGYDIIGELGRGGAGIVYRAYCSKMRTLVALKVTHALNGTKQEERFEREIRFLHRLDHPNLVNVYDSGRTGDGQRFLAMKYVDGTVLGKLFEISPPPGPWLARILSDIADGLAAAHGQGIIHRDVKPENIILSSDGVPILVDFGVAVETGNEQARLTSAGRTVGTPCYMAPEQILGLSDQIGSQTDMYSLGVVLYEGISGRIPFIGESNLETLRQIVHDPLPPLTDRDGKPVSTELAEIVERCLEKKPNKRFKSMESLADTLRAYAEAYTAEPEAPVAVAEDMASAVAEPKTVEHDEETGMDDDIGLEDIQLQSNWSTMVPWAVFGVVNGLYQWLMDGSALGWFTLTILAVLGVVGKNWFDKRANSESGALDQD